MNYHETLNPFRRQTDGMVRHAVELVARDMGVANFGGVVDESVKFIEEMWVGDDDRLPTISMNGLLATAQEVITWELPNYWARVRDGRERCHEKGWKGFQCQDYRGHRSLDETPCVDVFGVGFAGRRRS